MFTLYGWAVWFMVFNATFNNMSVVSWRSATKAVSFNPIHGEVYLIQHYVKKFVSDLRHVSGFLRVLWFPPPIKLTATI
jgi:hypothetical protein